MQQKWEYCVITGIDVDALGGFEPYYPCLTYFSLNGTEVINLSNKAASKRPSGWEKANEAGYVAHVIAKLGSEGWEMVGVGSGRSAQGTGPQCIYFRRPI